MASTTLYHTPLYSTIVQVASSIGLPPPAKVWRAAGSACRATQIFPLLPAGPSEGGRVAWGRTTLRTDHLEGLEIEGGKDW